jgi:hypothetical protein
MIDVRHPHPDGQPDRPHSHDYLGDLFSAGNPAITTLSLIAAHTLIALLTLGKLWRTVSSHACFALGWIQTLEPPPPRDIASTLLASTH